jgi:hypothetical protein
MTETNHSQSIPISPSVFPTKNKKMIEPTGYKLRIVIYNHQKYYQFIPESIYGYIKELPMWKFLENAMNGKILENKCFVIGRPTKKQEND